MSLRKLAVAVVSAVLVPTLAFAAEIPTGNDKLKVKVGGFLYGAAHYDQNQSASRPWLITVTEDTNRGGFSVDPYGSRFNFGIESQLQDDAQAKGFIELDWGTVSSPRLRHAYVALDFKDAVGVLVGQYWLPNLPILPETFSPNAMRMQGNAWNRSPQISLFRNFGPVKAMLTAASANAVTGGIVQGADNTSKYALQEQASPAGFLQLAYQINPKSVIAIAGGAWQPTVGFTGAEGPQTTKLTSWYSEIGTSVGFGKASLAAKAWYGVGAGLGTGINQSIVMNAENQATGIASMGGIASAKYAFNPKFSASLYTGLDDPQDQVDGVNLKIRRNLVVGGTAAYQVIEGGTLGLEVMNVTTTNLIAGENVPCNDARGSLIARYAF